MRSAKEECLSKLVLFGEADLRRAMDEFLVHYHEERNHQGRGNVLLFPSGETVVEGPRRMPGTARRSAEVLSSESRVMAATASDFGWIGEIDECRLVESATADLWSSLLPRESESKELVTVVGVSGDGPGDGRERFVV